ncbi:hypothetical protein V1290_002427 [Bradyrhizobium sp. AZCC 1578]
MAKIAGKPLFRLLAERHGREGKSDLYAEMKALAA